MPKMKTHKGLAKRVRVTAKGKIKHKPCGTSHLMSGTTGAQKRKLRHNKSLNNDKLAARIRRMLGA